MQLLLNRYIRVPCGNRLVAVNQKFQQQFGLPQFDGAVDGTHVPTKALIGHSDIFNISTKNILLQALFDSYMYSIEFYVGCPGRVHDARVFSNSSL